MLEQNNEVEQRKEQVYKELLGKRMTVDKLSEIMKIPKSRLVNTTRWLAHHNHLTMERVYDQNISRFIVEYTAVSGMPYKATVKKTKDEKRKEESIVRRKELERVAKIAPAKTGARIVRLLDNPLPSAQKSNKSTAYKGIGSSFSMYDYY